MPEPVSQHPLPGQIFAGRYRIERFLAQGGYGAVYVAEHLATEALVAIKMLWPHVVASEDVLERFELEAKVAGRVKSDFIVKILDAGIDEATRTPFLVMELLEGESLHDHVKRVGPLGLADVATFTMQIAQGLDKAHGYVNKEGKAAPIVHRDLKPENLFLTVREDGLPVVKILDFGIAKVLTEDVATSRGIKGTPLYMAHEQLHGTAVSPRTDVWALGLVTFFLLTGRSYWAAAGAGEVALSPLLTEVLTGSIDPPSERARKLGIEPGWSKPFDDWFLRCVNRDPQARFASAGEAASALAAALLGESWAATLPPTMFAPLSSSGTISKEVVPANASENALASVVMTANRKPGFGAKGSLLAGGLLLAGAVAYVALHRDPVLSPLPGPPIRADAHVEIERSAAASARATNPIASAEPAALTAPPTTATAVASASPPVKSGKTLVLQRIKAAEAASSVPVAAPSAHAPAPAHLGGIYDGR